MIHKMPMLLYKVSSLSMYCMLCVYGMYIVNVLCAHNNYTVAFVCEFLFKLLYFAVRLV